MEVERDPEIDREERAIYAIMLAASLPILIALIWQGRTIDGGNMLMMIVVALGLIGLVAGMRLFRRVRLPRARVVRER
jgi:hypothetical protein